MAAAFLANTPPEGRYTLRAVIDIRQYVCDLPAMVVGIREHEAAQDAATAAERLAGLVETAN